MARQYNKGKRYRDRLAGYTEEEYDKKLKESTTLYVGGLSKFTSDSQIHELFSSVGPVSRVIMGINQSNRTSCGFCFVVYSNRQAAEAAMLCLSHSKLDGEDLSMDWDIGFAEGRQFGRIKKQARKKPTEDKPD
eukprot:m.77672 g.77672  ORF g.77672 m.77672 type:complete len:134 (+) comp12635_c0_seq2:112-513(+)